jgi:TolB protein
MGSKTDFARDFVGYAPRPITIVVVFIFVLLAGCGENAPVVTSAPSPIPSIKPTSVAAPTDSPVPPLDGSGGGVIAYCFQPLSGGLHQLYAVNADGSSNQKIIETDIGLNHHDWSPDGQTMAAVGYVDQSTWSSYVFDFGDSELTRLTDTSGVWDSEPVWSPDGTRIAFTRIYPEQNDREEIWIMNADGSDQHWTGMVGFAARWSPDGTRLIYSSSVSGNYDLYTSGVDGSDQQHLTDTSADEWFASWSPDGSQIVYSASMGTSSSSADLETYEIFIMDADGSNVRQLTNNTAYDGNPRWSPDGTLIAFHSDLAVSGQWQVYVMAADGSERRQVTDLPEGITAINPVWRP